VHDYILPRFAGGKLNKQCDVVCQNSVLDPEDRIGIELSELEGDQTATIETCRRERLLAEDCGKLGRDVEPPPETRFERRDIAGGHNCAENLGKGEERADRDALLRDHRISSLSQSRDLVRREVIMDCRQDVPNLYHEIVTHYWVEN
jgi:hypothetical protein